MDGRDKPGHDDGEFKPHTPPRFRDPDGPELWERCGPEFRKGRRGRSEPWAKDGRRPVNVQSQHRGAVQSFIGRTSRARCSMTGTLRRSRWPPATSTALTCRFSQQRTGSIRKSLWPPFLRSAHRSRSHRSTRPGVSLAGHQGKAIETSPCVRRSCLAVVPHTWLARPCAPFRGSRCIIDNKGILAFCQYCVQKFSTVMPVPGLDPGIVAGIHVLLL